MKILEFFHTSSVERRVVGDDVCEFNFLGAGFFDRHDAIRNERDYWSGRCRLFSDDDQGPYRFHEDYYELEDLLIALYLLRDSASMIEVGAGYGRWLANFHAAALRLIGAPNILPQLIAVEADPGHVVAFMETMKLNDIQAKLHAAACVPEDFIAGELSFVTHKETSSRFGGVVVNPELQARSGRQDDSLAPWARVTRVKPVKLSTVFLDLRSPVSFINFDIQNAEIEVIPTAISVLERNVGVIHVSTHSQLADSTVRECFSKPCFELLRQFRWKQEHVVQGNSFQFVDGVQTYLNKNILSQSDIEFARSMVSV